MSRPRAFRPRVSDVLEDRTVPTSPGGFLGGLIGSVPAQDAKLVLKDFITFERTYAKDVQTILLAPGTTNPANNRAAFDQAVATALGTLNSSIDTDIANLPTASTLDTTIHDELLGSASTSLQSELAAIASPTSTKFRDLRPFIVSAATDIFQAQSQIVHQVATAPAPTGTIDLQTVENDLKQVATAFQTFLQTYNNDVKTILLAPGTTNPANNRTAFDQAVGTGLTTLNTSIASALNNLPASVQSSLATTIQNDLLTGTSTTGTSLQARLAAIPSPTSVNGFSTLLFRIHSFIDIEIAEGKVFKDILSAVDQFNSSLSG